MLNPSLTRILKAVGLVVGAVVILAAGLLVLLVLNVLIFHVPLSTR